MSWWSERHVRRARRRARNDAYVYCPGTTASMGWEAQDVDVCSELECTFPSGGTCLANDRAHARYLELCAERGIEP
jgi:hypothetical protein